MPYKAKNVDTDKALEHLKELLRYDEEKQFKEVKEVEKYHEGYRDGLRVAMSMFECANYEKGEVVNNE